MKNVQAYINNINVPTTIDEVQYYISINKTFGAGTLLNCFDEDSDEEDGNWTEWTVPQWTLPGDVVFFFHAVKAIDNINRLETELSQLTGKVKYREKIVERLKHAREIYNKYGGTIFAIGQVTDRPYVDADHDDDDEETKKGRKEFYKHVHWSGRIYAEINDLVLLENPIPLSDFKDFFQLEKRTSISPIFGESFDRLRVLITERNPIPDYLKDAISSPMPLKKFNKDNFIEIGKQYRRSFFLEKQYRSFYVNYLLQYLGDVKKFYKECRCVKKGKHSGDVDNVIRVSGRYLCVEVKLNIETEKDLERQLRKYSHVDKMVLDKKNNKKVKKEDIIQKYVLVIDTNMVFLYDADQNTFCDLLCLDDVETTEDLSMLKNKIMYEVEY